MNTVTTILRNNTVLNTISFALRTLGHGDLKVRAEWNRRFTRRMGDAKYTPATDSGRIRLSTPLWARATEQERRETVIHEVCHVVADRIAYKKNVELDRVVRHRPHGHSWQNLMLRCGVSPKPYHSVDRTGLTPYTGRCSCNTHGIGNRMYKNIKMGYKYRCTHCKTKIELITKGKSCVDPQV